MSETTTDVKPFWKRKTVWAALLGAATALLPLLGLGDTAVESIRVILLAVAAICLRSSIEDVKTEINK